MFDLLARYRKKNLEWLYVNNFPSRICHFTILVRKCIDLSINQPFSLAPMSYSRPNLSPKKGGKGLRLAAKCLLAVLFFSLSKCMKTETFWRTIMECNNYHALVNADRLSNILHNPYDFNQSWAGLIFVASKTSSLILSPILQID